MGCCPKTRIRKLESQDIDIQAFDFDYLERLNIEVRSLDSKFRTRIIEKKEEKIFIFSSFFSIFFET